MNKILEIVTSVKKDYVESIVVGMNNVIMKRTSDDSLNALLEVGSETYIISGYDYKAIGEWLKNGTTSYTVKAAKKEKATNKLYLISYKWYKDGTDYIKHIEVEAESLDILNEKLIDKGIYLYHIINISSIE